MSILYVLIIFESGLIAASASAVFRRYAKEQECFGIKYNALNFLPLVLFVILSVIIFCFPFLPQA